MALYEFTCGDCGGLTTTAIPMRDAPDLGEVGPVCGTCGGTTRRVLSTSFTFADAKLRADQKYPYVSRAWNPAQLRGVRSTKDGRAVIESASHEREVAAASGLTRD